MACERYRNTLSDVAAGASAPPGLEDHLAACEACRAELAALHQALAVADHELGRLAEASPSAALAARIRSAAAERAASPSWPHGWFWPSLAAAVALVVAVVVGLGIGSGRAPSRESVVAVATGSASSAGSVAPAAPGSGEPTARPTPPTQAATPEPRVAPPPPEVLVPAGEGEALLRLVALVNRQGIAPAALGTVGQPSPDLAELRSIDIQPLEIVPLDPAESSGT
jgi:hypothetical protein